MMAFAESGTTIVSAIGDNASQLSWQVQHVKGLFGSLASFV